MNAMLPLRQLLLFAIGLGLVPLFATLAFAGPSGDAATPFLQANIIMELVSDRARLIQVSLVFVTLGCALIWWYR